MIRLFSSETSKANRVFTRC